MPAVGDSKRAIDEYYSEICMGGRSVINIFNECEVRKSPPPVVTPFSPTLASFRTHSLRLL